MKPSTLQWQIEKLYSDTLSHCFDPWSFRVACCLPIIFPLHRKSGNVQLFFMRIKWFYLNRQMQAYRLSFISISGTLSPHIEAARISGNYHRSVTSAMLTLESANTYINMVRNSFQCDINSEPSTKTKWAKGVSLSWSMHSLLNSTEIIMFLVHISYRICV